MNDYKTNLIDKLKSLFGQASDYGVMGPGVQQLSKNAYQVPQQLQAIPDYLSQLKDEYIQSPEGEMFPQAVHKKPQEEQSAIWNDFFSNLTMGATNPPTAVGGKVPLKPQASKGVKELQLLDAQSIPKDTKQFGQYKLGENERFSSTKLVKPEEVVGGQWTVDYKIVDQKIKDIKAGKPVKPAIIKDGKLIDGYHTVEALTQLGYKDFPAVVVETANPKMYEEVLEDASRFLDYPNIPTQASKVVENVLYHETDPQSAIRMARGREIDNIYVAKDPDFALGQGGKGIVLEMDNSAVNIKPIYNTGTKMMKGVTGETAEYIIQRPYGGSIMKPENVIKSILVKPNAKFDSVTLKTLKNENFWTRGETLPDGSIRFYNNMYQSPTQASPLSKYFK